MSVLVWVHDHIVWLALGILPCAAAIGWGLWAGRYHPAHAGAGPVPERLWPLVGDPRAGSMILAEERAVTTQPWDWDWREVAHEPPTWREQTAAALAPATLDSGPGGPSLAPGPDWTERDWQPHYEPRLARVIDDPADCSPDWVELQPEPEPEPVWTVAGRLVETSDEWRVPWEDDPRFGSMQLAEDVAWPLCHSCGSSTCPAAGSPYVDACPLWQEAEQRNARGEWLTTRPLDWREIAHEGDWRAQTAADLAPATLDSGPGFTSLAPGPDPFTWSDEVRETIAPDQPAPVPYLPEPEPERTWAGRRVETSDEWLQRLMAAAGPGWTYAGAVAV